MKTGLASHTAAILSRPKITIANRKQCVPKTVRHDAQVPFGIVIILDQRLPIARTYVKNASSFCQMGSIELEQIFR